MRVLLLSVLLSSPIVQAIACPVGDYTCQSSQQWNNSAQQSLQNDTYRRDQWYRDSQQQLRDDQARHQQNWDTYRNDRR